MRELRGESKKHKPHHNPYETKYIIKMYETSLRLDFMLLIASTTAKKSRVGEKLFSLNLFSNKSHSNFMTETFAS